MCVFGEQSTCDCETKLALGPFGPRSYPDVVSGLVGKIWNRSMMLRFVSVRCEQDGLVNFEAAMERLKQSQSTLK